MKKNVKYLLPLFLVVEFGVLVYSFALYSRVWENTLHGFAGEVSPLFVRLIIGGSKINSEYLYCIGFVFLITLFEVFIKSQKFKKYLYGILLGLIIIAQNLLLLTIPLVYRSLRL